MRSALIGAAVVVAATAVLGGTPAAATAAAATGARAQPCQLEERETGSYWACAFRVPAPVIVDGRVVDHVRNDYHSVDCRAELDRHGQGPHPRRWVHTVGHDHGARGWVKDSDIPGDTNPLPVC